MSRSHGTGQPLWARCSKCRRMFSRNPFYSDSPAAARAGLGLRMQLTGRRNHSRARHIELSRRWRSTFGLAELGRYVLEITATAFSNNPLHDDVDKADRLRRIVKFAVDNDLYEVVDTATPTGG